MSGYEVRQAITPEGRAHLRVRLAGFAAIRAEIAADTQHAAHAPYWLATVSAGEHTARATLDWLAETRSALMS